MHTGFSLVTKLMNLNDLELWANVGLVCWIAVHWSILCCFAIWWYW